MDESSAMSSNAGKGRVIDNRSGMPGPDIGEAGRGVEDQISQSEATKIRLGAEVGDTLMPLMPEIGGNIVVGIPDGDGSWALNARLGSVIG